MRLFLGLLGLAAGDDGAIWFVSWQHAGHIKALCPIATELQRRGRKVRVVVHEEVRHLVPEELVASAGPLPWPWATELEFRQALWDPAAAQEEHGRKAELSEEYFFGSQQSLMQGLNATLHGLPRNEWPSLLAIDVSSVGAMDLAEHLSLRFAVVSAWPVGATLQSVGDTSSLPWMPSELFAFTQSAQQQALPDRLKRYLVTQLMPSFMSFAGFHEPRCRLRQSLGLSRLELLEAPKTSANGGRALLVILSHWGLDRARPLLPRAVLVGPVEDYEQRWREAAALPRSVDEWLNANQSVYISFGTNVRPKRQVYEALLGAAQRMEEVKFLWDVEEAEVQALVSGDGVQVALPAGNVHFGRVPQIRVLPRVSAFVTHCGLNSVHEALHFGVPMLGLPFVGDQMVLARLLAERGLGLRLAVPSLREEALTEALQRLLSEPGFKEAARHAGRLGRYAGGARAAADALEGAEQGVEHLEMLVEREPMAARLWDVQLLLLALLALPVLAIRSWWFAKDAPPAAPAPAPEPPPARARKKRS